MDPEKLYFRYFSKKIPDFYQHYFGNTLGEYIYAVLLLLCIWVGLMLSLFFINQGRTLLVKKIGIKRGKSLLNRLIRIARKLPFFVALFFAINYLSFPKLIDQSIDAVLIVFVAHIVIQTLRAFLATIFYKENPNSDQMMHHIINFVMAIAIWSIATLLILSNFGFKITTLAASLGIGGIAIAFAAQNILSDLFASFSIYFDRPFEIGDFISIGADQGIVTKIGLKTTRIKSIRGEELIVSNKELTSTRILNFKRMEKRRIVFCIGVEYSTPMKKLEAMPTLLRDAVTSSKDTEFSRAHFF